MFRILVDRLSKNKFLGYWYRCLKYYGKKDALYSYIPNLNYRCEFFHLSSYGNLNKDKIIYLINFVGHGSGFFAIYRGILQTLYIADRLNWVPYIIISDSHYHIKEGDNAFDYFFMQPSGLCDNDVAQSFNVVESQSEHMRWLDRSIFLDEKLLGGYEANEELIEVLADISKKYMQLKPDIKEKLIEEVTKLIRFREGGKGKIIGIHYRGNAYGIGLYGHPVKLEIEDYYPYIEECLNNGYSTIFVATDVTQIIDKLTARYGNRIVCYKDTFRSDNGLDVHDQKIDRKANGYYLAYEVLRDMHTLASCDALICGKSQVTISAQIEKISRGEKYTYVKIIDKGLNDYGNTRSFNEYYRKKRKLRL